MATVELTRQQLLIGGEWADASSGASYEQHFPFTGDAVGVAAAAGREDARAAVDAARVAFEEWSRSAPGMRRTILLKAADLLSERGPGDRRDRDRGDRRRVRLGNVQRPARRRDAPRGGRAGVQRRRRGDPVRRPGQVRDGRPGAGGRGRRDRAVERAGDPVHAGGGDSAGVRQHRRAQGFRAVSADACLGGECARGRRAAAGCDQPDHQRSRRRRRRGRGADRASGDAPDQLHRLDQGRPRDRREGRCAPQARAAGARGQGADDRAR